MIAATYTPQETFRMNGRVIETRGAEVVIFDGYQSERFVRDGVPFLEVGFIGNFTLQGSRVVDATGRVL